MKKYLIILTIVLAFLFIPEVKAVTKEDIVSISYSINTCNSKTRSLLKGYRSSYTRLLNERNVSSSDLNRIYNNIQKSISILNSNGICSTEQNSTVPESIKNQLYGLYKETNNILLASPKITDNKISETKMVVDSTTNEIKIYEKGTVIDVIKLDEKLNYVGLNKTLIISIIVMSVLLVGLIVLSVLNIKNSFTIGLIYFLILVIPISIIFRNQISIVLDTVETMKIGNKTVNKEVKTDGKKIISYPAYGNTYASIYINNKSDKVYFGDSSDILKKGIGQASSSSLPGENKTTILSGHNTGIFSELFNLKENNKFYIETVYGNFEYKVSKIETIKDTDSIKEDYDLAMYTCSPNNYLYGNKRIVVYSKLINSKWVGE